jgi:hypothetical protein
MSAAPEEPHSLPIGWQIAAIRLHEEILEAVAGLAVVEELLALHAPHPPQTSDHRGRAVVELFGRLDGRPVCQGCDRAHLTPTRAPAWPCSTYILIGQAHLGRDIRLDYTERATDDSAFPKERTAALRREHARSLTGPAWAIRPEGPP